MRNENHYDSDYTKLNYSPNNSKIPVTLILETKNARI